MSFPSTFSSFTRPAATDRLNNPSHSSLHNTVSSAVGQLEAVIGLTGASSVLGTIEGDLRSASSGGGGHIQTAALGGTGQTIYTKGDLLIASSSSVLTKLAVGADNQVLAANSSVATGVSWVAPSGNTVASFLSSSVWTRPSGISQGSRTLVQLWGGGGAGAGASGSNEAGGGGGGGYIEGWVFTSTLSASVLVAVGSGGTGGNNGAGTAGGVTVFDSQTSLFSAFGGGKGGFGASGAGGGGGGGIWSAGGDGSGATAGVGGGYLTISRNAGTGVFSSVFVSGGGASGVDAQDAYISAGGGGDGKAGGSTIYGGAGGGGVAAAGASLGGKSQFGGSGSNASILTNGSVTGGSVPGGGGGGAYGSGGTGGPGGSGKAVITTFY